MGKTKEMGWIRQHEVKIRSNKTASSAQPKPTPRAALEPRPYRRVVRLHNPLRRASSAYAPGPARFFVKSRPKNF